MKKYALNKRGFTLIELLVVIAIISLLSSIILAGLDSASQKAQDSKIVQSYHELGSALELYYNQFGQYPGGSGDYFDFAGGTGFQTTLMPLVTSGYISQIPDYPTWPNNGPSYYSGFFEYETDDAPSPDGSGDPMACGTTPWAGKGYVLELGSTHPLNLPHLEQINPDGSLTDDVSRFIPYYYCITSS